MIQERLWSAIAFGMKVLMNTNDIKIVLKVCETGSLAKAANLLFLTPQATSVAVKRVETELGVDLFVRAAGGMSMTDYGRDFQEKAAQR